MRGIANVLLVSSALVVGMASCNARNESQPPLAPLPLDSERQGDGGSMGSAVDASTSASETTRVSNDANKGSCPRPRAALATARAACATPIAPGTWVRMRDGGPPPTDRMTVAWTGKEMLVFGPSGGGAFDPCANSWRSTSIKDMPQQLPMYGGDDAFKPQVAGDYLVFLYPAAPGNLSPFVSTASAVIYDVRADRWKSIGFDGAPVARAGAAVAWTGSELFVFGGVTEERVPGGGTRARMLGDGALLDPATGRWRRLPTAGAPKSRAFARAVWTGSAVLVWGGTERSNPYQCGNYDTCTPVAGGALFDPVANAWTTLPEKDAPRGEGTLVSSPRAVLVGGEGAALFDLASCAWNPIAGAPQPLVDPYARAYSDGSTFVVLGRGGAALSRGAAWTVVPQPRNDSNTIWPTITNAPPGMNVAVLDFGPGGAPPRQNGGRIGTALRFDAGATRWERAPLPPTGGPASLIGPIVWTGDRLVFWGGFTREIDPGGGNGCGGAVRPCDPVVATRDVMHREGAMIAPVFAPY